MYPASNSISYLTREKVEKSQLKILLTRVPGGDELLLEVIVFPLIKMVLRHCRERRSYLCVERPDGLELLTSTTSLAASLLSPPARPSLDTQ